MTQKLFDAVLCRFKIKNTGLLMELLRELQIKHPQINHETKIQVLQRDRIETIEMPEVKIIQPGFQKKAGIKNKLARIISEIIPSKSHAGYEPVVDRYHPAGKTIWCKSFYVQQAKHVMEIRYIYLPEKDTLFVSGIFERWI